MSRQLPRRCWSVGSFTYTLTVTNNGDDPAYAVDVHDLPGLPGPTRSSRHRRAPTTRRPACGTSPSLPSGKTATLALTFTAPEHGRPLTNQIAAAAAHQRPRTTPTTRRAPPSPCSRQRPSPPTKTVSGTFHPGRHRHLHRDAHQQRGLDQQNNAGNEFIDVLPASLTLVSASATSGTAVANVGTNTVTWNGAIAGRRLGDHHHHRHHQRRSPQARRSPTRARSTTTPTATASTKPPASTDDPGTGGAPTTRPASPSSSAGAASPRTKTVAGTFRRRPDVTYTVMLTNTGAAPSRQPRQRVHRRPAGDLTLVSASATAGTAAANVGTNTVTWNGASPPAAR